MAGIPGDPGVVHDVGVVDVAIAAHDPGDVVVVHDAGDLHDADDVSDPDDSGR